MGEELAAQTAKDRKTASPGSVPGVIRQPADRAYVHPLHQLQQAIGNRAVQRLAENRPARAHAGLAVNELKILSPATMETLSKYSGGGKYPLEHISSRTIQRKGETEPPSERKACVKSENIPKDHTGIKFTQGLVYDSFMMEIDWSNQGPGCNCGSGEYRQYVKGHVKVDGQPKEKQLFGGAKLEENIFHEDADDDGRPYGHRDVKGDTIDMFVGGSKGTDRQNACSYRGRDMPGIPINTGAYLDLHMTFKGQTYDRDKKTHGKINQWESKYIGVVP